MGSGPWRARRERGFREKPNRESLINQRTGRVQAFFSAAEKPSSIIWLIGLIIVLSFPLSTTIPSPHGRFSGTLYVPDSSWKEVAGEEKAVLAVLSINLMLAFEKGEIIRAFLFSGGDSLYRGPKTRQWDEKTPCGVYRLYRRTWSRFPWPVLIDYPGIHDAEKALAEGRIDRATYEEIVRAHREGQIPPQNTSLGGAILIHGYPNPQEWQGVWWNGKIDNWTNGCLAPQNPDSEWLFNWVQDGTVILILEDTVMDSLMLNGQEIDPERLKKLLRGNPE